MKKSELKQLIKEVVQEVYSQRDEGLRDKIGDFLADPLGKKKKEYEKSKSKHDPIKQNNVKYLQACVEIVKKKASDVKETYDSIARKLKSLPPATKRKDHEGQGREWDHDIGAYTTVTQKWTSGGDDHEYERRNFQEKLSDINEEYNKLLKIKYVIEDFLPIYDIMGASRYSDADKKLHEIYNLIGGNIGRELSNNRLELQFHES